MTTNTPILSKCFANQTIEITRMKPPFLKTDANGIPLPMGYLCFSARNNDGGYTEFYTTATPKILQEVVDKHLHLVQHIKILLTFDETSKAIDMHIESNIEEEAPYGFKMSKESKQEIESELYDLGTKLPKSKVSDENECIIHVLDKPNKDGVYAEIKYVPKQANKEYVAEILRYVSQAKEQGKTFNNKDLLDGKYMITSVNNNGEYIYVQAERF